MTSVYDLETMSIPPLPRDADWLRCVVASPKETRAPCDSAFVTELLICSTLEENLS